MALDMQFSDEWKECSRTQTVRGRAVSGVTVLEQNQDGDALLIIPLYEMRPGQKVTFTVEEEV